MTKWIFFPSPVLEFANLIVKVLHTRKDMKVSLLFYFGRVTYVVCGFYVVLEFCLVYNIVFLKGSIKKYIEMLFLGVRMHLCPKSAQNGNCSNLTHLGIKMRSGVKASGLFVHKIILKPIGGAKMSSDNN